MENLESVGIDCYSSGQIVMNMNTLSKFSPLYTSRGEKREMKIGKSTTKTGSYGWSE